MIDHTKSESWDWSEQERRESCNKFIDRLLRNNNNNNDIKLKEFI